MKPPLSVSDLAAKIGFEQWKVRRAVDVVMRGNCPRIARSRAVPANQVSKIKAFLEAEERRLGK